MASRNPERPAHQPLLDPATLLGARLDGGIELLEDAWHTGHEGGPNLGEVVLDSSHALGKGDLGAHDDGRPFHLAAEDVGQRQEEILDIVRPEIERANRAFA